MATYFCNFSVVSFTFSTIVKAYLASRLREFYLSIGENLKLSRNIFVYHVLSTCGTEIREIHLACYNVSSKVPLHFFMVQRGIRSEL